MLRRARAQITRLKPCLPLRAGRHSRALSHRRDRRLAVGWRSCWLVLASPISISSTLTMSPFPPSIVTPLSSSLTSARQKYSACHARCKLSHRLYRSTIRAYSCEDRRTVFSTMRIQWVVQFASWIWCNQITLSSLNFNVTAAIADVVHFKSTVMVGPAHAALSRPLCRSTRAP
jgi:hypothetical protein